MRLKIIFGLFIATIIIAPILFPGDKPTNWMALFILLIVSLSVLSVVIFVVQRKSDDSFFDREAWDNASNIIDRALDGDIDDEFIVNKHFMDSALSREEFIDLYEDEGEYY